MVLKLIESCLEKDKKNRINIDEFIKHPWFKIIKKKQKNNIMIIKIYRKKLI